MDNASLMVEQFYHLENWILDFYGFITNANPIAPCFTGLGIADRMGFQASDAKQVLTLLNNNIISYMLISSLIAGTCTNLTIQQEKNVVVR